MCTTLKRRGSGSQAATNLKWKNGNVKFSVHFNQLSQGLLSLIEVLGLRGEGWGSRDPQTIGKGKKNTIVNKTNTFKLNRDVTSKKLRPPEFKIMMLFESNQDEKVRLLLEHN